MRSGAWWKRRRPAELTSGWESRRAHALLSEGEAAENFYRQAIDRLGRTQLRPELARAHLLYGGWLRREGCRVDARIQLRTAHELFLSARTVEWPQGVRQARVSSRRELPGALSNLGYGGQSA
jgi:hypothetical protein